MYKKILTGAIFSVLCMFIVGCASSSRGLRVLPEPEPNTVMVIGDVLLENIDREWEFDQWERSLKVVIVGKESSGKITHYTEETDLKGYYCLPNLPPGNYILKAVIFQIPGQRPQIIVNDFKSPLTKYYCMRHPENGIEYTANWFPEQEPGNIINHHITWFGLRRTRLADMALESVGQVLTSTYSEKQVSKRLWRDGRLYTRDEPLNFFRNNFPDSKWWKN